jgi:hypothetical protein
MREMGFLRPNYQESRDESVWTKTASEKYAVRRSKRMYKQRDGHFHGIPKQVIPVSGKLIVYLVKNNRFAKPTYSTECRQHEIPEILAKFIVNNKKSGTSESVVKKYYWNGKTYNSPTDLPFWGF